MNLLETLVYNLPEPAQTKALDAGEKSDDCCTVNCASIEVVEDYIGELQEKLRLANMLIAKIDDKKYRQMIATYKTLTKAN